MSVRAAALLMYLASGLTPLGVAGQGLPIVEPRDVGFRADRLQAIDALMARAVAGGDFCGGVVLVARHGKIAYLREFGDRQVTPHRQPMTTDTVFDLASITKPVATATAIMKLVEIGAIDLDAPVARYLPEFGIHGKESISARLLLTHQSGLTADNPLSDYEQGPAIAWDRICNLAPESSPGTQFVYSDVGFIVLAKLIQRITGQNIHEYSQSTIFQPLKMTETGYLPVEALRARAEVTEQRDGVWLQGVVHDPRAAALDGIAGNAGLFSTATDLAIFAQMLLNGGTYGGANILKPETIDRMIRPESIPTRRDATATADWRHSPISRCLGWDHRSSHSINRGDFLSDRAFGHGGFTGNVMWIDPDWDLFYIILTNRLHPDGNGIVNPLAGRIGTIAVAAIDSKSSGRKETADRGTSPVLTGIDVLEQDKFVPLQGRKIGLITNQTGVNRQGVRTATLLVKAEGVDLVALFSPEHGLQGQQDQRRIDDSVDPETGVPVYSLYGDTRRPTAKMLEGIDTLVFDIQDIGSRYYTYISTLGEAMASAAKHGIRLVVLDRPNPIRGDRIEGPVLDSGRESFVAFHSLPIRHGMTVGELARLFQKERMPDVDLEVIAMRGWHRGDWFDETELTWTSPSPNMRTLTAALLYSGIGWLETTNLSVGRGTDAPFEVLGAPWLDGADLARSLNAAPLAGFRAIPLYFTPIASKYQGQRCGGIQLLVVDRDALEPYRIGVEIAKHLRRQHSEDWNPEGIMTLLGNASEVEFLLGDGLGTPPDLDTALRAFAHRRRDCLLYD